MYFIYYFKHLVKMSLKLENNKNYNSNIHQCTLCGQRFLSTLTSLNKFARNSKS